MEYIMALDSSKFRSRNCDCVFSSSSKAGMEMSGRLKRFPIRPRENTSKNGLTESLSAEL